MLQHLPEQAAPPAEAVVLVREPVVGSDEWKEAALQEFFALQFSSLDAKEWEVVAYQLGFRAVMALILLIVAWTLSSWMSTFVRTALTRIKFDETLTLFLGKLTRWTILLLAGVSGLSYFGVQTASFAALIGAAGLAIGLAFQGTLSNFAAGAMLLIFRPFKVGDLVNVSNHLGRVAEIELFTTSINTLDNRRVIIPNSSIFGSVIENITHHPVRRIDVNVRVSYFADIDETRRVLEQAIASVEMVVDDPAPAAILNDLADSCVLWQVRCWTNRDSFIDAKQAVIRAVKVGLDQGGIAIAFPQLDIHLDPPAPEPPPQPEPTRWAPKISNT